MQVHDLGPLWVESEGLPVELKGKRMASALAVLVVNLNERVRADLLIESVWGDSPSPRTSAALDTLLWRLRRVLDPGRSARSSSALLRTERHGYRLVVAPEAVDSWLFDAATRTIAESSDPELTLATSDTALGLWRGRPYDDIDDLGWLDPYRARLLEQHLYVQQARIGALLQVGQPEQSVAELVPILAEHPFVEPLWCHRMLGLYRSGRTGAALAAYREVQELLDRELAMAPGTELQELQQRILRHDESLYGPPRAGALSHGIIRAPRHRTSLVGRAEDVAAVDDLVQRHRLVSITGPVGCGKTRLAVAVAERVQARFPGGVCFVDLSDVSDGAAVADRVQETLAVEGGDPAGADASTTAGVVARRAALLVLDNCEQVTSAASALASAVLRFDTPSRVLVTSRRVLGATEEVVYGLRPLRLPESSSVADLLDSTAVALFVERAAGHGILIDLDGPQGSEVANICHAIDGLPLSIELAAARARIFALHEIAASVADHPMSLGTPGTQTLRESIEASHEVLNEQEQIAHRRLSVLTSRFTLEAAVAVCADEHLRPGEVPNALLGLVGHSLLEATKPERPNGPSLFRQLVPIRAHAAQQLSAAAEDDAVQDAVLDWISTMAAGGPRMGQGVGGGLDLRLEDNRGTITAALESAIAKGPADDVILTLCRLIPYWWLDGKLSPETVRLVSAAAASVGPANSEFVKAAAIAANAAFLAVVQQAPSADPQLAASIAALRDAPAGLEIFAGELLMAIAAACWVGGEVTTAGAAADGVAAYGERLRDDHLRVLAQALRCAMGLDLDPVEAGKRARSVLDECLGLGNSSAAIMCYHTLYMAALSAHDGEGGLHWNAEAIRAQQKIGQRNATTTLEARGSLYALAGNPYDALRCYGSASFQYARLDRRWPQIPGTNEMLVAARSQLTPDEVDRAWASGERLAASDLTGAWI